MADWTLPREGGCRARTPAAHRYATLPEMADYERLMRAFAQRDGASHA